MGDVSLTEPLGNWATSQSIQPCPGTGGSARVECVSSILVGPNMDSNINTKPETVDGASAVQTTSEPPIENLASDIDKMRLPTKKLSGAQRKKLLRERKMREGTWTVENPHKKTSTCGKETGGGMKRPHSECDCPNSVEEECKKHRSSNLEQTVCDAVGIKMAVVSQHHPDIKLNQEQAELVQCKLIEAIDASPIEAPPPQFISTKFAQDVLWITCANENTKEWLNQVVSELGELWEGAQLKVVNSIDLHKRPKVKVWIPDTSDTTLVLKRLGKQNPELKAEEWLIMSRKVAEKGQTLAFSIDFDSHKVLEKSSFRAFWGLGRIIFKALKDRDSGHEDTAELPS